MLKRAINIIRPSVFQIQVQTYESKFQYKRLPVTIHLGTAFAVTNEGLLITALHVIEGVEVILSQQGGSMIASFAGPPDNTPNIQIRAASSGTGFTIVARDPDNDLALLKLPVHNLSDLKISVGPNKLEASPKACKLHLPEPEEGEDIGISGYPLNEPTMVSTAGHIASSWTLDKHQDRYLADITANPGNSGGPAYRLKDGRVIGVCIAGKMRPSVHKESDVYQIAHSAGLTFIAPAHAVQKILDQHLAK